MFCVECGKEGPIFRDGSCVECYLKNNTFTEGPDYIDINTCPKCSAYKFKNTWTSSSFEEILQRFIKEEFNMSKELHNVNIQTQCDITSQKTIPCKIIISGTIENQLISEEHHVKVRLRRETCDVCSRQYGGYYEAILQIRGVKRKSLPQDIETVRTLVKNLVDGMRAKGNRALFITDVAEEHGGVDFYLSEKGSAFTIAKKIYEQFGGEIKQSAKNAGMKDSKQLYRMTYLIRLPLYRKGDFLFLDDTVYYVSSLHENKLHVYELSTWTKNVYDGKDFEHARVLGGDELIKEMIVVSQTPDEVQLMNQNTYEVISLPKPKPVLFKSEKIKIIKVDDRLFLLPEKTINGI